MTIVKEESAGGASEPPAEVDTAAAAAPAGGTTCPETNALCAESPACALPAYTGRAYCVRWVRRIREEAIQGKGNA